MADVLSQRLSFDSAALDAFLHETEVIDSARTKLRAEAVNAEAAHFKELFGHLKVSYIEEDTREKWVHIRMFACSAN